MHAEGKDLSYAAVKDRSKGSLLGPAIHHFGSWRKAIEAAGIDYASVARQTEWNRQDVLRELRRRHAEGRLGSIQKDGLPLWAAAKRYFGSYRNAADTAGVPLRKPVPEWSWPVPRLQQALRELHQSGTDLSSGSIRRTHKHLFCAARARLGSWQKAVESIGVDYKTVYRPHEWSRQAIVDRLHELHAAGADLRAGALQKSDIPLSGAIQRYFGTLRRAMEAANIPYTPGPSAASGSRRLGHWTQDLVVKALRDLHATGQDLRYARMKEKNQPLFYAAKQLFGSYVNAVREAGIDYWRMSQANLALERGAKRQAAGDGLG